MIASRQKIIETGDTIFAQRGQGRSGLRKLAEQAGVNLAMVNYFFGSKKGLLKVILDTFLSGYHETAQQELFFDGDVDEKVLRFMKRIIPHIRLPKDYFIVGSNQNTCIPAEGLGCRNTGVSYPSADIALLGTDSEE